MTLEGEAMGYALAALAPPPHSSSGDDGPPPPEVPDADDDLFDAAEALEAEVVSTISAAPERW